MNRTIALTALSAALALAACSQTSDEPQAKSSTGAEAGEVETVSEVGSATDGLTPPPSPPPAPEASPSPLETRAEPTATETPATLSEIPAPIRGRWGLVPKDCTSTLGDAKGLLTVSAGQLKFYEAVAKLRKVKEAQDDRISGTFVFSGEGQTWTLDVVLDVQDGGKTLVRRDYGKDALPGPLKYTRCT